MQDSDLLVSLFEERNRNGRLDYELQRKRSNQQRVRSQSLAIPTEGETDAKVKRRQQKLSKYEPSMSDRESWWRVTIRDTPIPGTYDTHLNTFIKETIARPMTYGFKSDGRRRDPQPLEPKGKELLPGAYSVENSLDEMFRRRLSYGFKSPAREESLKKTVLANHDKDIDVAPGLYETQKYHRIDVPIESVKHSFFKSKSKRKLFPPQAGPAPGEYEPRTKVVDTKGPTITSSFRSGTDRFRQKLFSVPGPGSYDQLTDIPPWKQIDAYSTCGIFFNANFTSTPKSMPV
ncbi:unnamed protein product [Adineta ricciae]|uniref:Uncharacterized protein n=2 Tax=Adineta ricciae TaxID=249248 RepID=A0A813VSI7_ADIRI|nr:unnamed protein product [Adineta ricciae]